MAQPTDGPTGKVAKLRHYLAAGDLAGLGHEAKQYMQWTAQRAKRMQVGFQWRSQEFKINVGDQLIKFGYNSGSQYGEDRILAGLLRGHPRPFLVDVGAHAGRSLSNSLPFILRGWRAILLEPLPRVYDQLCYEHRNHPHAICLNMAASDQAGSLPLFLGSDGDIGMTSTLSQDSNEWFDTHRTEESIQVKTEKLTSILDQHDWPTDFGLLLVDAEGMDYEVLTGLDFTRYRPTIVVTEEYVGNPEKHAAKYQLLRANGYLLHVRLGETNTIWVEDAYARARQLAEIDGSMPAPA